MNALPAPHRAAPTILATAITCLLMTISWGSRPPPGKRRGRVKRRTGHHLLLRLMMRKDDVLRFLTDSRVPFTNNLAERAAHMMKLRQKISGGFRSEQGARGFAVIHSLIVTAKKQGWNVIHTLTQSPDTLLGKLRTA